MEIIENYIFNENLWNLIMARSTLCTIYMYRQSNSESGCIVIMNNTGYKYT
jgi:hypothetical protein